MGVIRLAYEYIHDFCEFVIPDVLSLFDAKIHCEKSNPSIFEIMSKRVKD